MGCSSSKTPPEPKIVIEYESTSDESISDESGKLSRSGQSMGIYIDILRTPQRQSTHSQMQPHPSHIVQRASWSDRRNSDKEKNSLYRQKLVAATNELQKRLVRRNTIYARCRHCNGRGPDSSNKYYGQYLVVQEIITKTKCKRCGSLFSFEYFIHVKDMRSVVDIIMNDLVD